MRGPRAKTLILDLLGTMRPGASMPVAALVEAGGLFGVPENNVRVALARLLGAGRVARDERGRYRLGDAALPIGRRVRGWRDLERRARSWRGGWLGVLCGAGARPLERRRARVLRLFGFAAFERTLWIRPDNLAASVDELRGELHALGLPPDDLVFRLGDLDAATERRARASWNVARIRSGYRSALARLEESAARLGRLPDKAAMTESFLVGGEVLRTLLVDPLLPDVICPADERARLLARMRDYDRAGRAAWASLLGRHDVPCRRAPIDLHPEAAVAAAG
jgi:phenylacetic acid degradation operon negative regulatory protein